jgi:hypothetical protein
MRATEVRLESLTYDGVAGRLLLDSGELAGWVDSFGVFSVGMGRVRRAA